MQIEEAKDAIARLIRDAMPATASAHTGATTTSAGAVNFFGGTNVVQIHIAPTYDQAVFRTERFAKNDTGHPAISDRRREVLLARIAAANKALGRSDYHLRFARSVYGSSDVKRLSEKQLSRILAFMSHEIASQSSD